jgi:C4-dicarboxylate-specific signal transduction histidine kinase
VGDQAEIRVSDNGPGIAPEHLSWVFDPFFTTKAVGKETGQGLAIAHSVIVD